MAEGETFYDLVYRTLSTVPAGRVVTYGQIARHLGKPRGSRAVGWAMRHCPEGYPWHRVVDASGRMARGSAVRETSLQRALLEDEGVTFRPDGTVDLDAYGWDGF